jgi:cytidine deaminase
MSPITTYREKMIEAAIQSRSNAYVPYCKFPVGASILTDRGKIFTGVNIDNASTGLGMCAERVAIFKAVSEGFQTIEALAVCTVNASPPCGACRQVLVQFANDIPIWICDAEGKHWSTTLYSLLPKFFGPDNMNNTWL